MPRKSHYKNLRFLKRVKKRRAGKTTTTTTVTTSRRKPWVPRTVKQKLSGGVVKMRWVEPIELNPGLAGDIGYVDIRANSAYKPIAITHQPMGYDQMSELFNHYVVHKAELTVQLVSQAASTLSPPICGVFLSDDQTFTNNNYTQLAEQGRTNYKLIPHSYAEKPTTLKKTYTPQSMYHIKDIKDNVSRLGAANNADPNEIAWFVIWCAALVDSDDISGVYGLVTIDYYVSWNETKEVPQAGI